MLIRNRIAVGLVAAATGIAAHAALQYPVSAGSPQHGCFDDSRYPHSWTHGDPTVGVPSSSAGNNGYYYLNVTSCGTSVEGAIWTVNGTWRIDIDDGYNHDHPLAEQTAKTPFSLTYNGVQPGQFIRIRFANESGMVHPDHASAYGSDQCALVGIPTDTSAVPGGAACVPDPNTISNQFTAGPGSAVTSTEGVTSGGLKTLTPVPPASIPEMPFAVLAPLIGLVLMAVGLLVTMVRRRGRAVL